MLDDLKYIHQRDGQDALGIAEKQWQQLEHEFETPKIEGQFENIVYAGMGGSALAAMISKSWPGYNLPFEIVRQYAIPHYVSDKTLFIACSYSGNTEETLAALGEAQKTQAKIVVIAGEGALQAAAEAKSHPFLLLPKAEQPRFAVLYNVKALITILEAAGVVKESKAAAEMKKTSEFLKESVKAWLPTVPAAQNPAKKMAEDLAGKSLAVYGGPLMAPVAYKWKINFNESAKNVAWWNELPEFDHNELIGWSSHPIQKSYGIIDLRSSFENPRVLKRFEVAERVLSGLRPAPTVVEAQGQTLLEHLLWTMNYGDFVSIYLALINNVNPSPVELVEKFKKLLNEPE